MNLKPGLYECLSEFCLYDERLSRTGWLKPKELFWILEFKSKQILTPNPYYEIKILTKDGFFFIEIFKRHFNRFTSEDLPSWDEVFDQTIKLIT